MLPASRKVNAFWHERVICAVYLGLMCLLLVLLNHFMNKIALRPEGPGICLMHSDFPEWKHCFASDFVMTPNFQIKTQ